jgi:hypothetical protein
MPQMTQGVGKLPPYCFQKITDACAVQAAGEKRGVIPREHSAFPFPRPHLDTRLNHVRPTNHLTEERQMNDPTETIRRERVAEINLQPGSREALEVQYGQVWNTDQLSEDFEVLGFLAPLVVVRRKSDGRKGSLEFQHSPRIYFNYKPH